MDVPPPAIPGANVVTAAVNPPSASAPASLAGAATSSAPAPRAAIGPDAKGGLAPAIAKLFGGGAIPRPLTLNVSYRVLKDPSEIVTVFTDPRTGEEIAQFPPEVIIGLAEFFDQQQGATLDQSA